MLPPTHLAPSHSHSYLPRYITRSSLDLVVRHFARLTLALGRESASEPILPLEVEGNMARQGGCTRGYRFLPTWRVSAVQGPPPRPKPIGSQNSIICVPKRSSFESIRNAMGWARLKPSTSRHGALSMTHGLGQSSLYSSSSTCFRRMDQIFVFIS